MQNSVLSLSSAMVEEFMLLPSVGRVLGASGAFGNSGFQSVRAKMPHVPHFFCRSRVMVVFDIPGGRLQSRLENSTR